MVDTFLEILFWLCVSYVLLSFMEYAVHRWLMHDKYVASWVHWDTFERHTLLHHCRWYRDFDKESDVAAKHVSLALDPLLNVVLVSPIYVTVAFFSWIGAIIIVVVVLSHAIVWTYVHSEMHEPKQRWFCNFGLYKLWRRHHKTHHEHPGCNFNILCLGVDRLFGTYKGSPMSQTVERG